MAKRSLKDSVTSRKSPLDLAAELGARTRSTARLSISLTDEERQALEDRSADLRRLGHRDLKVSRLARVAFAMLLQADNDTVLSAAATVEDLEQRRAKR